MKTANRPLGALLTLLSMLGFAGMDAISKWTVADYSIGQMMWIRYAVFSIVAWLIVRPRGGFTATRRSRRPVLQVARSLIAAIESAVFVLAFSYLPLADTHALGSTSPLMVILLGALFLGERIDRARGIAVVVGFVGMLMIVRPGFRTIDWTLFIPVAGALLWAIYQLLTRFCGQFDSADTTLVWSALPAFAATCVFGPLEWVWPDAVGWCLLIAIALLGALSHYALIRALDHAEASVVQPYAYSLLVWATVLGLVVFGDFPDGWTIAGAAVIVASTLYTWHQERKVSVATP